MRLFLPCMSCFEELGRPDLASYPADILNNVTAKFVCQQGHKSVVVLQSQKFAILAELAVTAILDGYYREAVSTFASSLERFQEFYIKTVLRSRGFDLEMFEKLWKGVHKQSERQFGAYQFVFGLEEGEPPRMLSNNKVTFRNKVIHQGLIPTYDEAIAFGQSVADVVNPVYRRLTSDKSEVLKTIEWEEILSGYQSAEPNEKPSTMSIATLLGSSRRAGISDPTVGDWLSHTDSMRNAMSGKLRELP